MQYTYFPKTNLNVSRLCLGTMMFGGQTEERDAIRIMDEALDLGVNFFDTANVYNGGMTEEVVGRWLKDHRNEVILASKVGLSMGDGLYDIGLGRSAIVYQVEQSLKRLQTDHIDIYYMHAPDYHTDFFETMQTLDTLVKAGKIRHIGVSNHAAWQMADILHVCEKYGFAAPVVTQNVLNPVTRGIESELLPFLNAHPMALCTYNPLAAGLLTGKYTGGAMPEHTRFSMNPRYKARFGVKAKMLSPDDALALIGHAVGGVCPFAVNEGVKVYLDESLKRFQTVYPACGSSNSAIEMTIPELEKYACAEAWVDVCKGWREE
jgi:aryl-alcohol dehydrogenase-like predicted oxidoreductase